MTAPLRVAVLVGSLRAESFTRKLAKAFIANASPHVQASIVEIGDLGLFNEDLETATPPPAWTAFRDAIRPVDAILLFTPEYNRSIPGVLKNALDVGSRPYGKNVFAGKPGAIVSTSPGPLGGMAANHALRQPLVFLDVIPMQQPEGYFSNVKDVLGEDGKASSPEAVKRITGFLRAFEAFAEKIRAGAKG
ncbi:MAG TPA: NAD(P)H-dependent oxidoreductase [Polyangiaceae bacterium]